MKLWIRSQDKTILVRCNDIAITTDSNDGKNIKGYKIVGYFDKQTEYETLGFYTSKERSLEILDEIQNSLLNKWANNVKYEEHYDDEEPRSLVYEMPKE